MVVEVKDFFKNNPHFMQNSVLIMNDSNVNRIKIFGAEWLSPLDSDITYCGDNLNKIELVKKGLTDYYHNNPKLHYYIVYYNDSTIEEQGLIDETYNFFSKYWSRRNTIRRNRMGVGAARLAGDS